MTALSGSQSNPPSTDITASAMESTSSKFTSLGDPKYGGALFTLPRELRDEIYRLLVKGRHTVYLPLEMEQGGIFTLKPGSVALKKPDLAILQTSRAISREAQETLYSESLFRYCMSFYASKALEPSAQIARRIKKVKMIVSSLATESDNRVYHEYQRSYNRRVAAICEATIDNFRGARILRDACHVIFVEFIPDMIKPLTNHILPKLKNFKGFRTVLVEVSLDDMYEARVRWEKSQNMGAEGEITAQVEQIRKAIKNAMEPTLGPATTVKDGHEISLKFHPRQHVPRLLRAKAQQILLDADRMEEGD